MRLMDGSRARKDGHLNLICSNAADMRDDRPALLLHAPPIMDEGERVLAVRTTSVQRQRKCEATLDIFLGLFKWTAPPAPLLSLKLFQTHRSPPGPFPPENTHLPTPSSDHRRVTASPASHQMDRNDCIIKCECKAKASHQV
ncbi:hypothetical protein WMY93_027324 [Mugilogobius chulae]|uniref:Uncharacterized protein n=1 Tax=Mugilogobius chulae TaxID=88201 RepID=A0AAW0MVZ1_9GOBI